MKPSNTQEFIAAAREIHGYRYEYGTVNFSGMSKHVIVTCRVHGQFRVTPHRHLAGHNCMACMGRAKKTAVDFAADAKAIHGDKYDYSRVIYKNNKLRVEVVCPEHGSFFPTPVNHLVNRSGCPSCSGVARVTQEQFLLRARQAHGDWYDYSKAAFTNVDARITITCPDHGDFEQIAYSHLAGHGCIKCGIDKCATSNRRTLDEFIAAARERHGEVYDYSRVVYVNSVSPIEILCPIHGPFWQVANGHLESTGCPMCSTVAEVSREEFLQRAVAVHGNKYDYSEAKYSTMRQKVSALCSAHGAFMTLPKDHIAKASGCPQCAREQTTSAGERELADWLAVHVEVERNRRDLIGGFEIDIYIPELKVGVEFNGAYWHSDSVMQHPNKHETKTLFAENAGIRLITVWDFDWLSRKEFVKSFLLHQLGMANSKKTHARKCSIRHTDAKEASAFYDKTHIQGAAWRAAANYGLHDGSELVACMSFGQGGSRRGKVGDDEWELVRYSTIGSVRGGAGRLFAAFVKEHQPRAVWSFSDRQHFSGKMYRALGFFEHGKVAADYRVLHQSRGIIWHKSAWQRRNIPARLIELGIDEDFDPDSDPRTERDIQAIAGVIRIMDSGKIRWQWCRE